MIKNNKDLIFVIIVITWLLFGLITAFVYHLPTHIASLIMVGILCIIILFQKFTRFGVWLESSTLLINPKKVKNKILKLSTKRQKFVNELESSYDDAIKDYTIPEPIQIDDLGEEIYNLIKKYNDLLEIDVIIEELTKIGHSPCILYDDNGHFAVIGDGFHTVVIGDKPVDMNMNFHVDSTEWFNTIREALKNYLHI